MKILRSAFFYFILFVGSVLCLSSCGDDDVAPIAPGTEGFFVVNEGLFGSGNASLSFFDKETNTLSNNVFAAANDRPLGDQAQSMEVFNERGYIVVQNSATIEIIDPDTFESIQTITAQDGIISPRYFLGVSADKGYITDWGTTSVLVMDLNTFEITKSIPTGSGPNRMIMVGDRVFVANSGGFGRANTVTVINTTTDQVISNIEVDDNPRSLQVAGSGNIWLACFGHTAVDQDFNWDQDNSTLGSIIEMDVDGNIITRIQMPEVTFFAGPDNLLVDIITSTFYYIYNGAVYSIKNTDTEAPSTPFINTGFYGISLDPSTGNIIGADAGNFTTAGNIQIFDDSGAMISEHTSGVAPNGCAFR
ncbi:MAG: DUF5074 domain-containing protein [Bacteroidota bacterium]